MSWIGLYRVADVVVVVVVVVDTVVSMGDASCRRRDGWNRDDDDDDAKEVDLEDEAPHCTVQLGSIVLGATHSVESMGTYLDNITSFVKAIPRCTL